MMRSKLQADMQQRVDDEDDRIAKAVAEREQKRIVCYIIFYYQSERAICDMKKITDSYWPKTFENGLYSPV